MILRIIATVLIVAFVAATAWWMIRDGKRRPDMSGPEANSGAMAWAMVAAFGIVGIICTWSF